LRTTKIVVEEAGNSPEVCGTFSFAQSSRKSEISVEEVGSFTLNSPSTENIISEHKEMSFNAVVEEIESDHDISRKMSREISIVSVSEDEKVSIDNSEKDDAVEDLMRRIQRQRSALNDIIETEQNRTNEVDKLKEQNLSEKQRIKVVEKIQKEETIQKVENIVHKEEIKQIIEAAKQQEEEITKKQEEVQPEGSHINCLSKLLSNKF
jgi:hypothetical protein